MKRDKSSGIPTDKQTDVKASNASPAPIISTTLCVNAGQEVKYPFVLYNNTPAPAQANFFVGGL